MGWVCLDGEAEAILKGDASGTEELAFDDGWAEEPCVFGVDRFFGIPNAEVGKGSDVSGWFGPALDDELYLCLVT